MRIRKFSIMQFPLIALVCGNFIFSVVAGNQWLIGYLLIVAFVTLINRINYDSKKLSVSMFELLWLLFPIGIMIVGGNWISAFLKFLLLGICLLMNKYINYDFGYRILLLYEKVGLICALSVILEALYPPLFFSTIYKLFSQAVQDTLYAQVYRSVYYSGIMPEVSLTAGLICFSIFAMVARKNIKFMEIMCLLVGLFMTGKRAHLFVIALIVGIVYLMFAENTLVIKRTVKIMVLLIFLYFIINILMTYSDVGQRLERILELVKVLFLHADESESLLNKVTSGRYSSFMAAWNYYKESPLRGKGWGYFAKNYYNSYLGTYLTNVHNIYLQLLCDSGMIGFLSFVIPAFLTLRNNICLIKKDANNESEKIVCRFALCMQLFFLLYGCSSVIFDAPLYYISYYIAIILMFMMKRKIVYEK